MGNATFPTAEQITRLQNEAVDRWHQQPIASWNHQASNPKPADPRRDSFLALVCQQHECNFRLWHEEDKARSRSATDQAIAQVKRSIDKLNQLRNDRIEQLDDAITQWLDQEGVTPNDDAKLNTETPGSVIDRLSIMSLRIYHYHEQLLPDDVDESHRQLVTKRIALCRQQLTDLSASLQELISDLFSGLKRHKTYRQMKMYNDPTLNPLIDGDPA